MLDVHNSILRVFCKVREKVHISGHQSLNQASAETVKVPQMAESITEGTLKSWSKQVGDSVAADEEVATIETDKVCGVKSYNLEVIIKHLLDRRFRQCTPVRQNC